MRVDRESRTYTVVFSFLVTFAFVLVLSALNVATAKIVDSNQRLFKIKAVLNALGLTYDSDSHAVEMFESLKKLDGRTSEIYVANVDGVKRYAIVFHGSGLWGPISGVLAVEKDLQTIAGLDFISQSETPGLGGRIEEPWFKEQFVGERASDEGIVVSVVKTDGTKGDGKVDAITGSTLTSKAIERIVNATLAQLKTELSNIAGSEGDE